MKIAIIGAGASGVYASILLKRRFKNADVTIYEASDKILSKVKASGNGRCNIDNLLDNPNVYNDPAYMKECFKDVPIEKQLKVLDSFGIYTKELMENYLYPLSESGLNVKIILENLMSKLNVKIKLQKKLINYNITNNNIDLFFEDGTKDSATHLILAYGSHASLKNNDNLTLEENLKSKNYKIKPIKPGLAPIKVKENVKNLFGQRIKCKVSAYDSKNVIFEQNGEVLFKKDGLSGIVIFNLSSVIARNNYKDVTIKLDVLDDKNLNIIKDNIKNHKNVDILYSFFSNEMTKYIIERSRKEKITIFDFLSNFTFTYQENYPINNAQIALGGIEIENLDVKMMSKHEKKVYFIGEACNIDGYCGGFNLKWALISAIKVSESLE